jgi:rabenosyn-5
MIAAEKRKSMRIVETTLADQLRLDGVETDAADDVALMLQPLLEQEAQLEMYIADAHAQRKYEDGKALGQALKEIQAEIGRVTRGAAA